MTQTFAILRHIGRKHNLAGKTEQEIVDIETMEELLRELVQNLSRVAYDEKCEELKPEFLKKTKVQLSQVSEFLKNRKYIAGDRLTYVDFWGYEALVKFLVLTPDMIAENPVIKTYIERIENLPAIAAYKTKFEPKLFMGPMAKWNGTY